MAKRGPKSQFGKLSVKQIQMLILKGFEDKEIAEFIGITPVTYCSWKSKHKEFFKPIIDWKKNATPRIERSLFERAEGYSHEAVKFVVVKGKVKTMKYIEHYPPDTRACEVWLYNQKSDEWSDKKEIKHSGEIIFTSEELQSARNRAFANAN